MKIIIHTIPDSANLKQIKTQWKAYSDLAKTDLRLDEETFEPNLLRLETPLIIPTGVSYYFEVIRTVEVLDANKNNIYVDDGLGGMKKLVKTIGSVQLTKLNSEEDLNNPGLIESEFDRPLSAIMTHTKQDNVFTFTATEILPNVLIQTSSIWTVYDSDNKIIEVIEKTVDMNTFTFDNTHEENVKVTLIQMADKMASPVSKVYIDLNKRINIDSFGMITPTVDYVIPYTTTESAEIIGLNKVELLTIDDIVIDDTLYNDSLSIIIIDKELLDENTKYKLRFVMTDNGRVPEYESFYFETTEYHGEFRTDKGFKYNHNFKLVSSNTISRATGTYIEKRPDGRFLISTVVSTGLELGWSLMETGELIPQPNLTNTITLPSGANYSTSNLQHDNFLLVDNTPGSNVTNIRTVMDSFYSNEIVAFSTQTILEDIYIDSVYYHKWSQKLFVMTLTKLYSISVDRLGNLSIPVVLTIRPDNLIEFVSITGDVDGLIFVGGSSDYTYRYDVEKNSYSFFSVLPPQFVGIKLNCVELVNGDIAIFPRESNVLEFLLISNNRFHVKAPENSLPNIVGIVKSNGVVLPHNLNSIVGYLV